MTKTTLLLHRWYEGDDAAYEELLEKHLDWILRRVRQRLGEKLRQKIESIDVVQDTILSAMQVTPKFTPRDGKQFRGLLSRIVENQLRDHAGWFAAKRRDMERERAIPDDMNIDLSKPNDADSPDEQVAAAEMNARIRFVMELLPPKYRNIVILRDWDGLQFPEIAKQLGISSDAARRRYDRTAPRIEQGLRQIRTGDFEDWLQENERMDSDGESGPD